MTARTPEQLAPGELDLHLFNEGSHRRLWDLLGSHVVSAEDGGGVRFAVWAPNAREVRVFGDWDGWAGYDGALHRAEGSGIHWGVVPEARDGDLYKFQVTGADGRVVLHADPMARAAEVPPGSASRVATSTYQWHDEAFLARRGEQYDARMSIYEVHAASWRRHPDGRPLTYRELAEQLPPYLIGLGFTHVEFMPFMTHPFGGSWGYQVTGYYAPDARLGTPDDLRFLIDRLHEAGIGVILDWVPAHFPKDEWALARFDGTALYEHEDWRRGEHPDWGTYVFNHGRHEVRNFLVANALYWISEFHIDALRVDAVASMLYLDYSRREHEWVPNEHGGREDLQAIGFLQDLNRTVGAEFPGAMVIAEESTAWQGVTSQVHDGGLGFARKWNLGWMHDTLSYLAHEPVHRAHHHHEFTFPMVYGFDERWVLPLSHDEVVHGKGSLLGRMPGDEWQRRANLRALLAWQWSHPGRQLLFAGGELAMEREWYHDAQLDWHLLDDDRHAGVWRLVGELNRLQDAHPALWRGDDVPDSFQWLDAGDAPHSVFPFLRRDPADDTGRGVVVCVANLTPVPRHGYRVGLPCPGRWVEALNTDDGRFGGSGLCNGEVEADDDTPWQGQTRSGLITLPPLGVLWMVPA